MNGILFLFKSYTYFSKLTSVSPGGILKGLFICFGFRLYILAPPVLVYCIIVQVCLKIIIRLMKMYHILSEIDKVAIKLPFYFLVFNKPFFNNLDSIAHSVLS